MASLRARSGIIGLWLAAGLVQAPPAAITTARAAPATARPQAAGATVHTVAIASQPLGDALAQFARQTGLPVLHPPIPPEVVSPGVSGRMPAREALERLLAGTSLEISATARRSGGFVLRAAGASR